MAPVARTASQWTPGWLLRGPCRICGLSGVSWVAPAWPLSHARPLSGVLGGSDVAPVACVAPRRSPGWLPRGPCRTRGLSAVFWVAPAWPLSHLRPVRGLLGGSLWTLSCARPLSGLLNGSRLVPVACAAPQRSPKWLPLGSCRMRGPVAVSWTALVKPLSHLWPPVHKEHCQQGQNQTLLNVIPQTLACAFPSRAKKTYIHHTASIRTPVPPGPPISKLNWKGATTQTKMYVFFAPGDRPPWGIRQH